MALDDRLAPLAPLLGRWRTEGTILSAAGEAEGVIAGHDTYEPLAGGHWVVHTVDVSMAGQPTVALELIGDPGADGAFRMRAFDGGGAYDEMDLTVADGELHGEGDGVRFTMRPADDGATTAITWERRDDDTWRRWMDMTLTREDPLPPPT